MVNTKHIFFFFDVIMALFFLQGFCDNHEQISVMMHANRHSFKQYILYSYKRDKNIFKNSGTHIHPGEMGRKMGNMHITDITKQNKTKQIHTKEYDTRWCHTKEKIHIACASHHCVTHKGAVMTPQHPV